MREHVLHANHITGCGVTPNPRRLAQSEVPGKIRIPGALLKGAARWRAHSAELLELHGEPVRV
mgnify:CR=1 FL=1